MSTDSSAETAATVRNVGGINEARVTFEPGVTILTGENATNRTSLLSAIAGAFGGDAPVIKSDADEGTVELDVGGVPSTLRLERQNGSVRADGESLVDDAVLVDHFVRLLEDNPLRRAVTTGADLHDLLMAPVDTERIESELDERLAEREETQEQLERVEQASRRLPDLEERRRELRDRMDAVEAEIETVQAKIDEYEASKEAVEEAEAIVEELESAREAADRAADRVESRESELERLEEELAEVESDLTETEVPEDQLAELDDEIEQLTRRRRELERSVSDLQGIVDFNRDVLEEESFDHGDAVDDDDPTAALDPSSREIECWTCGSTVEQSAIADRLETLESVVAERRTELTELKDDLDELESERDSLQRQARKQSKLADRRDRLQRQLEAQCESLEEAREEYEQRQAEVEELRTRMAETEELRETDLLEQYQQLSELEYERGQLDRDLDEVEAEIERAEGLLDEREQLESQLEEYEAEIERLRSHVTELEQRAVEEINEQMEDLFGLLDYENVERVWVERKTTTDGHTDAFELHVVRTGPDGAAYEDTVETLSESERELIGLVLALSGYLVHDVAEEVPFVLLDSLEAIDAKRIAKLVDYFAERVPYLIVALLPEDADALSDEYTRLTPTDF